LNKEDDESDVAIGTLTSIGGTGTNIVGLDVYQFEAVLQEGTIKRQIGAK